MARRTHTARSGRYTPPARAGKVIVATGLGLLALTQASAAGAAETSPTLRWKSAGSQGVEDGHLRGTVHLRATVTTEQPVDGWSLSVLTTAQEPIFGVVCHEGFKRPRDAFSVDCRWDTTRYPDRLPSANAHYLVRLMTQQGNALQPAGPDRDVAVTNQASAPADVTLTYDEASRRATLRWAPNPEPDVAHYDVEEKIANGPWARVAEPTSPRFERVLTEPGDHRYRIAAERRNADGQAGGPGPWSSPDSSSRASVRPDTDRPHEPARGSQPGTRRRSAPDRRTTDDGRRPAPDRAPASSDPAASDPAPGREGTSTSPAPRGRQRKSTSPAPAPAREREGTSTSPASDPRGRQRKSTSPAPAPTREREGKSTSPAPAPTREREGKSTSPASDPAPNGAGQKRPPATVYDGPPPENHSSIAFSPSSAEAFASLHDAHVPRPALANTNPAVAASAKSPGPAAAKHPAAATPSAGAPEEPDAGFQETLPYPHADAEDSMESAPTSPTTPPDSPPPAETRSRRSTTRRRVAGGALVLMAAGLLGTVVQPPRRRTRRRPIASLEDRPAETTVAPEAVPPEPVEAAAPAGPTDEPVWLPRLEACIARLEALVAMDHDTDPPAPVRAL